VISIGFPLTEPDKGAGRQGGKLAGGRKAENLQNCKTENLGTWHAPLPLSCKIRPIHGKIKKS